MNKQQIEQYVADYLSGASEQFLQEIVDHGIYNTGATVVDSETDEEYNAIADEFENQAKNLLNG